MYAIVGIDRILNWVADRGCPYWTLYDTEGSSRRAIASNWDQDKEKEAEKKISMEEAQRSLKASLDLYDRGARLYLWVTSTQKNRSGGFYTWILLPDMFENKGSGISGIGQPVQSIFTPENIQEQIKKGIEEYQLKKDLETYQEKIKGLEQEVKDLQPGAIERILTRIEPYLDNYILPAMFDKKTATTKAIGSNQTDEQSVKDAQEKAEKALDILAENEPGLADILWKLAMLKKENPQKYEMAKKML